MVSKPHIPLALQVLTKGVCFYQGNFKASQECLHITSRAPTHILSFLSIEGGRSTILFYSYPTGHLHTILLRIADFCAMGIFAILLGKESQCGSSLSSVNLNVHI